MEEAEALIPAILLLAIGISSIVLMRRLGLSPIVGYMLGGMVIGGHALGWFHESSTVHLLAELGVVFLLFDIGLHFSVQHIWDARRDIFGLGPIQITLCSLAFIAIALSLGYSFEISMIVGGSLALSSTAVVSPTLQQRQQNNCPVGRTATAVLILQDILAIFLLVLASSYGGNASDSVEQSLTMTIFMAAFKGLLAFGCSLLLGRYVLRPLFAVISRTKNEEIFTAIALLIVLAMAAASGWLGLSLTLGAFLGGMMLSETPFRHLIRTEAKPFRDLLLAFFFIAIGASLDWRILLSHGWQIIAFASVVITIKAVAISLSARIVGWSVPGSMQLGFLLAQGSEFVFVIVSMPSIRSAFGEETVSVVFIGVALSLALTPTVAELGNRLAREIRKRSSVLIPKSESIPIETVAPVIVYGMDEVGRTVADALEAHQIRYEAVERDYDRFTAASVDGYQVVFGDLSDLRLAQSMAMDQRRSLVLANVRHDRVTDLMPIVNERFPSLTKFISTKNQDQTSHFEKLGIRAVAEQDESVGISLARQLLRSHDIDEAQIESWIQRRLEHEE
ncbi:cation:proton antiporter domain-containing protein [Rubripirellula amarantea]|nr:cation:proton antiporter [Rubripirellula amarantea]